MTTAGYPLSLANGLMFHGRSQALVLQDGDIGANRDQLELDARVHSGYYFISLSSTLETVAEKLTRPNQEAGLMLDRLIQDLDYLQEHYTITKRRPRS